MLPWALNLGMCYAELPRERNGGDDGDDSVSGLNRVVNAVKEGRLDKKHGRDLGRIVPNGGDL